MNRTKILIVDDYQENIEALSNLIAADDVEIFRTTNADEALEMISKHEFGLALLDVQMPGISGFELAKIIRSVRKFRSLPIIFVTAHQEDSTFVFEGYQTGAVDLLFKPLIPNMVRAKVQMFVELAQQRDLLQTQVWELERLRIEAESANMAKSQFLANMSHEIRTPLAAVMGFSDLLLQGNPSEEERSKMNAAVQRNGNLLLRLIDDILDLSKIEANKLELDHAKFDLNEMIRDIGATLSFRSQEKGLSLQLPTQTISDSIYLSDPLRIKQVLLNIVGNAIKFTTNGTVSVSLNIEKEKRSGANFDRLVFKVTDQGLGLTNEQAERLFQPFTQADSSTRRSFGGSGLGLVISRQIARALGGDVKLVSSTLNKGSTFEISFILQKTVDFEKEETNLMEEHEYPNLNGLRILAVDDSADNLTLISMYLKDSGAEVILAQNGMKAISEVRSKQIDIILMDVQMPGMDGHETTEEIRKLGFKRKVIALTAHVNEFEHEKCRRSGCDKVLTKPIKKDVLLRALSMLSIRNDIIIESPN